MKKIYENIFDYSIIIVYVLYFIIVYNLYSSHKISFGENLLSQEKLREYLDNIQTFLRLFVMSILLIRFNPLSKITFNDFDRKLVFTSALFLLSTTGINEIIMSSDYFNSFFNYLI